MSDAPDGDAAMLPEGALGRARLLVVASLAIGFVFLYGRIAWDTLVDCWRDPNYSYGILVPVLVLFLIRQRRLDIHELGESGRRGLRILGWSILVAGLAFFVLGQAAAEHFTMRFSGILVAVGLLGVLGGPDRLRRYGPPLGLLVCMVPLPYVLYYKLVFPLQLLSARLAAGSLDFMGLEVVRSGNVFEVDGHALEVVRACSGIRSIMVTGTLAATAAVSLRLGLVRGLLLVLVSPLVALCGNILRLVMTSLLVLQFGLSLARGPAHDAMGVLGFVVSLALLAAVAVLAQRTRRTSAPIQERHRQNAPSFLDSIRAGTVSRALGATPLGASLSVLLLLVLTGCVGTHLRGYSAEPGANPKLVELPLQLDEMVGEDLPIEERVLDQIQADAYLFRTYRAPVGPEMGLYVGYYRSQRQGSQIHSPMHCYPGGGWKIEQAEPLLVCDLQGRTSEVRRLVVEKQGRRDVVVYWYDTRTGRLASDVQLKLNLMRTALFNKPQDAAFVRWSTPVAMDEDVERATVRLLSGAARAFPHLQALLPFGS